MLIIGKQLLLSGRNAGLAMAEPDNRQTAISVWSMNIACSVEWNGFDEFCFRGLIGGLQGRG